MTGGLRLIIVHLKIILIRVQTVPPHCLTTQSPLPIENKKYACLNTKTRRDNRPRFGPTL